MNAVTALDVSAGGKVLAIGREKGSFELWDPMNGTLVARRLENAKSRIMALRFSPNGEHLAVVADDGTLTFWSAPGFEPIERLHAEPSSAVSLAFSRDGATIATLGRNGHVHIWEVPNGKRVWAAEDSHRDGTAYSVTFLDDMLVVGFESGILATWVKDAMGAYAKPGGRTAFAREVYALTSQGELVVAGGNQGGGVLLFQGSGEWPCFAKIKVPRPMAVNAVALSPDHTRVAAACSDGVVRTVELGPLLQKLCASVVGGHPKESRSGEPSRLFEQTLGPEVHTDWTPTAIVSSVAFVNEALLVSGHFDGEVRLWRKSGAYFGSAETLRLDDACRMR